MEGGVEEMTEASHRKRLAQILRYIASMHQTLNGDGVRHSFVRQEDAGGHADAESNDEAPPPQRRRRGGGGSAGARQQQPQRPQRSRPPAPPPSDFFQIEAANDGGPDLAVAGSGSILFTANDFAKLLALEHRASSSSSPSSASASSTTTSAVVPLFDRPLFSFYAASGGGIATSDARAAAAAKSSAARKRTFAGALKSTFSSSFHGGELEASSVTSTASLNGKPCWLRITRLTNAQIMTRRPNLDRLHPYVRQYLEEWRRTIMQQTTLATKSSVDDDNVEDVVAAEMSFEELLTLNRFTAPPPLTRLDARAASEVRGFLRQYKKYLLKKEYQERLEPMYNRLFEWVQQRDQHHNNNSSSSYEQPEELVFGLGHARLRQSNNKDGSSGTGTTWVNGPLLEVLVEVELARDGALLVRPRDHTGVSLNRQVVSALVSAASGSAATPAWEDTAGTVASFASSHGNTAPSSSSAAAAAAAALAQLYRTVGELEASQLAPGQPMTYIPILKRIAMELSSNGSFQPLSSITATASMGGSGASSTAVDRKLRVTEAWCLYARPKPSSVWARDAMAFADMIATSSTTKNTRSPARLPRAAWSLTHGPRVFDNPSFSFLPNHGQHGVATSKAGRLLSWLMRSKRFPSATTASTHQQEQSIAEKQKPLFPLPASEPQHQIAELLLIKQAPAVVCEGPPGTGKTHTIANIICAYLCQGKRVLVTSKNAPALSVVRNRLPPSIQDLCVDVSMSELSGMRQLQQTVERLANRVSCVGTSSGLQAEKCCFLRGQIKHLEQEISEVDGKLLEHSTRVRSLLQQIDGKQLVTLSLELIEAAPWLMRLTPVWTVVDLARVRDALGAFVLDEHDPVFDVTGFDINAVDDGLVSKVASCAGQVASLLSNAAKSALAAVPVLGSFSGLSDEAARIQEKLECLRIRGNPPVSKEDWKVVFRALSRVRAITLFELTTWKPHQYKNAWPVFPTAVANNEIRIIHEIFCKAVDWKELAVVLDLPSEVESAVESRSLDAHRSLLSVQIQRLAEDLVDAEVMEQLSRSFSTEAQSALIRFSQIAGRARFGRTSSSLQSKMSQRQKRRREEYLEAFDQCCRFIPCWILTSSQISDYLPPECIFDLVIIDEASQSDITVLPGMLRATQWLTVGDSKQVSPTESFIAEEQIESLRASLPVGPLADSLMPGHSFFDLCAQAFPQGRVVLSEHFRCAEEIINFSNEQFYDGRLVPLRLPTKSERLTPSIVDVKVDGTKVGKVNQAEANKIVEMIQEIVEESQDTATAISHPRTIGIISLLGDEQARLIRGRLLDVIGPHMMARHEILVGVPPSFQGAERDIIFLSMVASPGAAPTQNQVMHVQRVNVAMSRARDRCVLVRSIDPHHIANQEDIKLPVIEFFQTAVAAAEMESTKQDRGGAISNDTNIDKGRKDSPIDVLLQNLLEQRGFIVHSMGVVWRHAICVEHESEDRRAALIVDSTGDLSSSVQEWLASYAQQKAIQRVGWKCMRVDALSLIADFNGTMQSVVSFLASAGIEERPVLYDQLDEEDNAQIKPGEMQVDEEEENEEEMEGVKEVELENLDGIEPEGNRLDDPANDDPSNRGDENQEEAAVVADPNQPEEVVVISSDDDMDDRKMPPPPALAPPRPDNVTSGHLPIMEENDAGDFGQVVQLGFLEQIDVDDPTGLGYARRQHQPRELQHVARSQSRTTDDEDISVASDSYQGDLSDMGGDTGTANRANRADESGRQTSNRRRRLDQYSRDPGWYPSGGSRNLQLTTENRDLYDTDSDADEVRNDRRQERASLKDDHDYEEA